MGEAWDTPSHSASPLSTTTAKVAPARTSLRPPIFNPYDRFTQPEFDAWIGDITSSLRRALRHEVEPDVDSHPGPSSSWKTVPDESSGSFSADGRAQSPTSSDSRDEESVLEDSFAQIASRKAKGKARDPREGPGLGLKDQPIELLSDSEEGEVVDSLGGDAVYSENSDESSGDGSSGETDCGDSELAEGREGSPGQPGTSTQHIVSFLSREDAGNDQEVAEHSDAEARNVGDEGDPQLPERMKAFPDDYGSGDEVTIMQDGRGGTEDEFFVPNQRTFSFDVELTDPWEGPRTFAEDYYSGGDRLAPGLTPNHLTPVARSPVPALVPDFPTAPDADIDEDGLSVSSSVLSTSLSPRLRDTARGDKIIRSLQHSTAIAASVNDERGIDELADVTENAVENAGCEVVWSAENVGVIEPTRISKEDHTSHLTSANWKTRGQNSDQRHGTTWVSLSDDERTDADGEEDEGKLIDVAPLGTSDLDIRNDWGTADRHKDIDDLSDEEDELQAVSSQSADNVANTAALTLSLISETVNPSSLNGV
ncbi:hypothetical protein BJV78DRAFT_490494 [Lactifluus subvellereus]|nr:hypothetical protein BJV78DRAFT_490494 [Lactifluus subvellereus]